MEMTKEVLKKLYIEDGKSAKEIAEMFDLTKDQIKGKLRRWGIRKLKLKLGNEKYDNREWLYNEYIRKNKGYTVIANEQNVSYTTILDRILYFGWELRGHDDIDKGAAKRGKKLSKESIEKIKKTRVKNRVNVSCDQCGKTVEKQKSGFERTEKHFCNPECFKLYLKENRVETVDVTDSAEYKEWRLKVYKIDGYRCKMPGCGSRSKQIHAHHIYKKKEFPEKMFDVENGITLCRLCHQKTYGKEEKFIDMFVRIVQKRTIEKSGELLESGDR